MVIQRIHPSVMDIYYMRECSTAFSVTLSIAIHASCLHVRPVHVHHPFPFRVFHILLGHVTKCESHREELATIGRNRRRFGLDLSPPIILEKAIRYKMLD